MKAQRLLQASRGRLASLHPDYRLSLSWACCLGLGHGVGFESVCEEPATTHSTPARALVVGFGSENDALSHQRNPPCQPASAEQSLRPSTTIVKTPRRGAMLSLGTTRPVWRPSEGPLPTSPARMPAQKSKLPLRPVLNLHPSLSSRTLCADIHEGAHPELGAWPTLITKDHTRTVRPNQCCCCCGPGRPHHASGQSSCSRSWLATRRFCGRYTQMLFPRPSWRRTVLFSGLLR